MNTNLISEMENYAHLNNVPIMIKESLEYIISVIKLNNYSSVLEIGSAIGYSSIFIASNTGVSITTIERDIDRYNLAVNNISNSKCDIKIINKDALDIEINDKYDLIIIDAAKSQNIKFFEKYKNNLKDNGTIIIDNMNFHGLVHSNQVIESRNVRQMIRKLEAFWDYLDNQNEYNVLHLDLGDGLAVCKKNI